MVKNLRVYIQCRYNLCQHTAGHRFARAGDNNKTNCQQNIWLPAGYLNPLLTLSVRIMWHSECEIHHSLMSKYLSQLEWFIFVLSVTLYYKSCLMLCWLLWMWASSIQLLGVLKVMPLHAISICTVEWETVSDVVSYVFYAIEFCAIHHNMGPAQWDKLLRNWVYLKVTWINKVCSFWIDLFNCSWNSFG
jgi:hypothetical protein